MIGMDSETSASSSESTKCRSSKHCPAQVLWNQIVGSKERVCIPSNRLPTNRVIMQRFHTMKMGCPKNTPCSFANELYQEIIVLWEKANVPNRKGLCTGNH